MKNLAGVLVAILFAGYGMAVPSSYSTIPPEPNFAPTTPLESFSSVTTPPETITEIVESKYSKEGKDLVDRVTHLREELSKYETRVSALISNSNSILRSFDMNRVKSLIELKGYFDQLPIAEPKIRRQKCYCENRFHEPCPQRCINSCYVSNCNDHYDDCTDIKCSYPGNYFCYRGSPPMNSKDISNCYDPPLANECSSFAANQSNLEQSFVLFAELVIEPAKIKMRDVQHKLKLVKESVRSVDMLSNMSWQHCKDPHSSICFPEATQLIENKVEYYEELSKNITGDFIECQKQIDLVDENLHVLKEGTIKQINTLIKKYACCLKGLNFKVEGVDCESDTTEVAVAKTTPWKPLTQTITSRQFFRCGDGLKIPIHKVCDEVSDCYDNEDENNCEPADVFYK